MNSISIIIPTYNSGEHIGRCLRSIKEVGTKRGLELEIIVVDSNSGDETLNVASKYTNHLVKIEKTTIGNARNLGAEIAKYETLAFLDSDCEVTESWINSVSEIDCLGFEMLTGPVLLAKSKTTVGESVRDLLSDSVLTLNSLTFSDTKMQRSLVDDALSANLLISREVFREIGGFPELSFNEDTLFSARFRAQGGKITYDPKLMCIHHKHFDDVVYFAKYFFDYGKNYARTLRKFGLFRRYAIASLALLIVVMILVSVILLNLVTPLFIFSSFAIVFLTLLSYSVLRNRKLSSLLIPILFMVLIFSYTAGFYSGYVKKEK